MNNEPVAWMLADKEKEYIRSIMAVQHDFVPQGCVEIPLYTHPVKEQDESFDRTASHMAGEYVSYPVKELTDEEIEEVINQFDLNDGHDSPFYPFARAILLKAQE